MDTKVGSFVELVEIVRIVVGVFEHYSNKDFMITYNPTSYLRDEVSMGVSEI